MPKRGSVNTELLRYVHQYNLDHGFPPVLREIRSAMGWSSHSTAHFAISRLESLGYITKIEHSGRTIRLTQKGLDLLE